MQRVSDRVYVETGHLGSNNSVLVADDGLVLFDAPHKPTDAIRWAQTVAAFGEPRYLVNSDHHPDHTIGNNWLGGVGVAHAGTRQRLAYDFPDQEYLDGLIARIDPEAADLVAGFRVRLPSLVFTERLTLHMAGLTLELLHVPGHTANSVIAYFPEDRVILTGDNVCEVGLPSFQDAALGDWFDALDVIEGYDFDVLVCGHGEPADRGVVATYRKRGRELVAEVAAAIASGEPRERAADRIRFEDRIHVSTPDYVGYPGWLLTSFQQRSVRSIYDALVADPGLADR
ncbi:MAG: MBL fold metallo-hydrolase [Streptosporangiales bacterium]